MSDRHESTPGPRRALVLLGAVGLCAMLPGSASQAAMTFQAVALGDGRSCGPACPTIIRATGEITQETPAAFTAFVRRTYGADARRPVVFLDSMGGRVVASMELGFALRQLGATAVVAGIVSTESGGAIVTGAQCFSACVYAFMGASDRVVPPRSQIGIHRMFVVEEGTAADGTPLIRRRRFADGAMRDFLMHYSRDMGVSPALIVEAEHISSGSLHLLTRTEIRRFHLAGSKL